MRAGKNRNLRRPRIAIRPFDRRQRSGHTLEKDTELADVHPALTRDGGRTRSDGQRRVGDREGDLGDGIGDLGEDVVGAVLHVGQGAAPVAGRVEGVEVGAPRAHVALVPAGGDHVVQVTEVDAQALRVPRI